MIGQSGTNPTRMVIDPQPEITPTTEPEGQWQGLRQLRSAAVALVQSLNPCYEPPKNQPPIRDAAAPVATDFPALDNQTSHCPGFTILAVRTIAAYANLPPEINQALGYLANLVAAGQAASDQFDALTAPAGVVPGPGTDWENAPDEAVKNAKKKTGKAPQYRRQQPDKTITTATTLRASQLPNTSLALGALVGLSAVASSASDSRPVSSLSMSKICRDKGFPCDGEFYLVMDIDGSDLTEPIGEKNGPFTGKLFGDNYTVNNLRHCLVKHLAKEGLIDGLRFKDANILQVTGSAAGVAACEISGNARVSNIMVENANIKAMAVFNPIMAGIAVGKVEGGAVINTTAVNCTVKTLPDNACAGIGAGNLFGGYVINTQATNCTVETQGANSPAGIGAGNSTHSGVTGTTANNCQVKTAQKRSDAGIGTGKSIKSKVTDTNAVNCTVSTSNVRSDAGIGAGASSHSTVANTNARHCKVSTSGVKADAGIGAGESVQNSTVINTNAAGCNVTISGSSFSGSSVLGNVEAHAGIGAGISINSKVNNTMAHSCIVKTINSKEANAGIGVGVNDNGAVTNTTATGCTLETSGDEAKAGIGAGINKINGIVNGTTAQQCKVTTSGDKADAGIGAGENRGTVIDTAALASNVTTGGNDADAGIGSGLTKLAETVTRNTIAIQSNVITGGDNANAGIGAGFLRTNGVISNTKVLKCKVKTSRFYSNAGFGAGKIDHRATVNITNSKVFKSRIRTGKGAAAINAGHKPVVCQVLVKGQKKNCSPECFDVSDINFCADINQPRVKSYCHDVFDNRLNCDNPPLTYPTTETVRPTTLNISSPDSDTPPPTTVPGLPGIMNASSPDSNTPPPTTVPGLPGTRNTSGPVSDTMTTPPTTPAMLTHSNKIPSGPDSATTTPPTNTPTVTVMTASSSVSSQFATPSLTKSLSPAFIAIIATLGAAFVVLCAVIGVYTHRNCQQRSSTSSGRNQPITKNAGRRPMGGRSLPAIPQPDHQSLLFNWGNQAPVGSYPMANTGKEYNLPMNQNSLICENKSDDHHYDQIADLQLMVMESRDNNSIENTGKDGVQPSG